VNNFALFLK